MTISYIHETGRFQEIIRDMFLSQVELSQLLITLDKEFEPYRNSPKLTTKISNRSYFVMISSLLEEFNSDLISLNDKYVKKITKIQKTMLESEDKKAFLTSFLEKADRVSSLIQRMRDEEIRPQIQDLGNSQVRTQLDAFLEGVIHAA